MDSTGTGTVLQDGYRGWYQSCGVYVPNQPPTCILHGVRACVWHADLRFVWHTHHDATNGDYVRARAAYLSVCAGAAGKSQMGVARQGAKNCMPRVLRAWDLGSGLAVADNALVFVCDGAEPRVLQVAAN